MTTQSKQEGHALSTATQHFAYRQLAVEIYVPPDAQKFDYRKKEGVSPSEFAGKTIRLAGFRTEADINCCGMLDGIEALISVANVPQDIMNGISGFGQSGLVFQKTGDHGFVEVRLYDITQYGGNIAHPTASNGSSPDDQKGRLIYRGSLLDAVANLGAMPDPFLTLHANVNQPIQTLPAPVISFKGSVPTATICQQIADGIGFTLENNGVSTTLVNPYLTGNYVAQLDKIANSGGDFTYVLDGKVLAIWPKGGFRQRSVTNYRRIDKNSGLIGVPAFNQSGVIIKTLFQHGLAFGDKIEVASETLPNTSGFYAVRNVNHHLSSEIPGGPWESEIEATFLTSDNDPVGIARRQ